MMGDNIPYEPLTGRELEILSLIASGLSNRQIADQLFVAHSTIRWYIRQIYSKLGAENREQAVELAAVLGLTSDDGDLNTVYHNLPAQTTPFVGRERDLKELAGLLSDPDVRLITILAPGGMGKTRLALALAETILDEASGTAHDSVSLPFPNGIFFIPLAALSSADHIVPAIAERTGYHFQQDGREPKQQLLDYFREKAALLVLDNFEHLLDGANIVSEILQSAPRVQVIATSRERLNLNAETVYTIGGMIFPDWETPEKVVEYDAVELFMHSARRVKPDFTLQDADLKYLARISRLVEGMPLGIILAAGWIDVLSSQAIAEEITRNIDFLAAHLRDIPERQHSIRAVFDYSWKRLSSAEQDVLMKLAVFRGGCTREAAQTVAGATAPLLQGLINKSLLVHDLNQRYETHELLRQFAEEQLAISGEGDAGHTAHSVYYANLLYQLGDQWRGAQQLKALNLIEQDIENVRAGWQMAVDQGMIEVVEQYLESLYYFYSMRSRVEEGDAIFNQAVKALVDDHSEGKRLEVLGKILARQGNFAHRLGHYRRAAQLLDTSLKIMRKIDLHKEIAFILNNLADVERAAGHYHRSQQYCLESLAIFRELGDERGMAATLNNLGVVAQYLEAFEDAARYYRESLEFSRRLDDQYGVAASLINLGAVAHDREDYEEAQRLYRESLNLSERLGDRYGVAAAHINLGRAAFMLEVYTEGKRHCEEGLSISRQLGDLWGVAASLINLGDVVCRLGALPEARGYFHEALQIVQTIRADPLAVEIVVGMADLLAREGKQAQALSLLVPVLEYPTRDRETRDRVERLWSALTAELPETLVASIREQEQSRSLEETAERVFGL